jgi:hypothetical protein
MSAARALKLGTDSIEAMPNAKMAQNTQLKGSKGSLARKQNKCKTSAKKTFCLWFQISLSYLASAA